MKLKKLLKFTNISIFKTLYVNFKKLPFSQAIKLPIIIYHRTEIASLQGIIKILGKVKTGMIQFNNNSENHLGRYHWRRIEIRGEAIFTGKVDFGVGSVLYVRECAKIILGDNVKVMGKARVLCEENIVIGNNVRLTHECQLTDSNFHYIRNIMDGSVEKCTKPIRIGNNNWIGNRTTIAKGTVTPDFTIVGSNSLLNKDYSSLGNYSLLAGIPAKKIADGFERIFDEIIEHEYNVKFGRYDYFRK
ncbi:MAG: acyltransferase [Fibrobacter sp.]|jgi:acetyltransferase-like isoleucine patch superfamily enzyme|nr:acyltransferase [Fibrobacter sp.]